MSVDYRLEPELSPAEFIDVLVRSTLAERRPVDQPEVVAAMLTNADIVLTARIEGRLVGVARAVTDFSYCTYLSDLAVDVEHQGRGIGSALVRETLRLLWERDASGCVLVGEPAFYSRFGFKPEEALVLAGVPPEYFQAVSFDHHLPRGSVTFHAAFDARS